MTDTNKGNKYDIPSSGGGMSVNGIIDYKLTNDSHMKEWQQLKEYYIERLHAIDRLIANSSEEM